MLNLFFVNLGPENPPDPGQDKMFSLLTSLSQPSFV